MVPLHNNFFLLEPARFPQGYDHAIPLAMLFHCGASNGKTGRRCGVSNPAKGGQKLEDHVCFEMYMGFTFAYRPARSKRSNRYAADSFLG